MQGSSPVRHLFEPSEEVSLRFYLKLSQGWGWSGRNYHPHLTHFLTTENSKWHGPAASHLTLYVEPVGYTIREEGGEYSFSLTADFTLVGGEGQILGGQRDFGRWEMSGRRPVTEFMMYFTFDFEGLPAGTYTIETLIKDSFSDRTLELSTPVAIIE